MKVFQSICTTAKTVMLAMCIPIAGSAATVNFTGAFANDAQVNYYMITAAAGDNLLAETFSYGGSTNPVTPAGGFLPVLSLFSSSGMFLQSSETNGVCGPNQNPDPMTAYCGDALLQRSGLAAGIYTLALSEFPNVPNTPDLAAGFLAGSHGSFTGENCGQTGGMFLDTLNFSEQGGCVQRNSSFTLSVQGIQSATSQDVPAGVPEPFTLGLAAPALLWIISRSRKVTQ